jgi:HK97 gp10 family phage protein
MPNFIWRPKPLLDDVNRELAAKFVQMGEVGVAEARRLVPVDTGQTRDSIGYTFNQGTKTLQLYADTRWAIFLEMGTSRQPARPFLRPALAKMAKVWGGGAVNLEMGLANAPSKYHAGYKAKTGSHVNVGRKGLFGKRQAKVNIGRGRFE